MSAGVGVYNYFVNPFSSNMEILPLPLFYFNFLAIPMKVKLDSTPFFNWLFFWP